MTKTGTDIFYLDTSILVAYLTLGQATPRIQSWLGGQPAGTLAVSGWVTTEMSSALAIKLRRNDISLLERARALAIYRGALEQTLIMLPIYATQFRLAANFADSHTLSLRGGDALHLAICAAHGATLCTLDDRQRAAGLLLGIQTVRL